MKNAIRMVCVVFALGLVAVGCGDTEEEPAASNNGGANNGGKTDEANNSSGTNNGGNVKEGASVCGEDILNNSGNGLEGEELIKSLNDPIANMVLHPGESCPGNYAETMAKLREMDSDDRSCKSDNVKGGIASMVVSETAQIAGEPTNYRVVVTRTCNGRAQHQIFFSLFGVRPAGSALPGAAEVMAFDEAEGVYNYYEVDGRGEWTFFGNSKDLIEPGAQMRCAQCHTGGGPVMKELDTPWLHWEGHEDVPGARELVDANDDLGSKSSGSTMESLTKAGNREWNKTRVNHLKENASIGRLLEPLFCTVEVNVDNGSDFKSSNLSRIPNEFYLDPEWSVFGSVDISFETYQAALTEAGQQVTDGSNNLGDDTIFDFVFPERAFADLNYVDLLVSEGIVDQEFVADVQAIDFTRPIFSEARCGLLQFAPESVDEITPDAIRDAFIANLEGAEDEAAQQLKTNLESAESAAAQKDAAKTFLDACKARPQPEHIADVLMMVTLTRNAARDLHVFEFPASMPFTNLTVDPSTHFDPVSCELVTD